MAELIKAGLIGYGYWGPNLARNLSSSPLYKLMSIADLSEANLAKAKCLYPAVKTMSDYKTLVADKGIDLVVISTPIETHYEIAKVALKAGKHVLVEKPLTKSVAEAEELVKLAKKMKRCLVVDHTFLFTSVVRKMKEIIANGELGDIYFIDSERMNLGLIQQNASVFWDLAVHDLSIVTYLLGGELPKTAFAKAEKYTQARQCELGLSVLKYGDNKLVSLTSSWLSPIKTRRMIIVGSKKMIYYDDVEVDEKLRVVDKGVSYNKESDKPFTPIYRSGDVVIPRLDNKEAIGSELGELYKHIREGASYVSTGEDGLRIVKLLESIDKSLETGKEIKL